MKNKIFEIVESAIKEFDVKPNNNENEPFRNIIKKPLEFTRSTPKEIKISSLKNKGETEYQRKIFNAEDFWFDMELPIGQWLSYGNSKRLCSKRIDLIGFDKNDGKYILCELKYKKEGSGNPFDAVLQVLAYYQMLKQNHSKLQAGNVRHILSKSNDLREPKYFDWNAVAENIKLQIRANKNYWANWQKDENKPMDKRSKKNRAANYIISECEKIGLIIETKED